ncbi:MAG: Crp/Fnr family transcriptional regulator [Magnetococcales bacterium]|nr:Crp/Fnr family transcriptional regulator [Magnetococcales bacterium]
MTFNEMASSLKKTKLFASCTVAQLKQLHQMAEPITLEEGDILVQQDDVAEWFYWLKGGCVQLFRTSLMGSRKIYTRLEKGEFVGAALLFQEDTRHPVTVQAVEPSKLMAFRKQPFREFLWHSPATCFRMMGLLSSRLQTHIQDISELSLCSPSSRLANFLLNQIPPPLQERAVIELALSRTELAQELSVKPETLSRLLGRLQKQGVIEVQNRIIRVPDVAQLQKEAGGELAVSCRTGLPQMAFMQEMR